MHPYRLPRPLGVAALLLLVACQGGRPEQALPARADTLVSGSLSAGPALWHDPQLAPHPAWNYPTASHPPAGEALPKYWAPPPAAPTPAHISGLEFVAQAPLPLQRSAGFAVFGSLALLSGFGGPTQVVDISDPTAPRLLSRIATETRHRGAQFIAYPDGRLLAVFANNRTIEVWELSDPRRPRQLYTLEPAQGNHNVGVVPGTPVIYNAASDGGGSNIADWATGFTEIYDLSDPDHPRLAQNFVNGFSCHDVRFWNDAAQNKYRAICAGVEFTQLWDIADPLNPEVIVSLPVHHGIPGTPSIAASPAIFSHFAALNASGQVLIVGDETGGGIAPGCVAHVDTPSGGASSPSGALFFYDVRDESDPQLLGWFSPDQHFTDNPGALDCTVHFGRLVPNDEGRDLLAIGAYSAGTLLVDFSNPALPQVAGHYVNANSTWEAWYHNGWIFSADLRRGLEVLRLR